MLIHEMRNVHILVDKNICSEQGGECKNQTENYIHVCMFPSCSSGYRQRSPPLLYVHDGR